MDEFSEFDIVHQMTIYQKFLDMPKINKHIYFNIFEHTKRNILTKEKFGR